MALLAYAIAAMPGLCAEELRLAAVDHSAWDALLAAHVNEQHRVDYQGMAGDSLPRLEAYLAGIARPGTAALPANESKALLINAYNALTIRWIVRHYPAPSIWSTPEPFKEVRHTVAGKRFSLDQIESILRETGDPRIHAALVCAARSCPPLRREAYTAGRIDEQLDDNTRRWLANRELNRFDAAEPFVSPIFKWYGDDFKAYPGGLQGFLKRYAPEDARRSVGDQELKVTFLDYDWGLNGQSGIGEDYSFFRLGLDWLKNVFR